MVNRFTIFKIKIKTKSKDELQKIENLKIEHNHYINNKTPENLLKHLVIVRNKFRGFQI